MPTYTPEMDAELAKEMESRKAAAATPAPAKAEKATPATPAPPDKVEGGAQAASVSGGSEGAADKGTPPAATPAPDLSWLPEQVRSKVSFSDPEAADFLKHAIDGGRAEATKRFQEAAAVKRDAENYRSLVADPDIAAIVAKAAADKLAGRPVTPAPIEEAPPQIDPLDPATFEKAVDYRVRKAQESLMAELNRPAAIKAAVNASLSAYAQANNVDPAVMIEAVKMADQALVQKRRTWDPDTVDVLIDPYVALAKAQAASKAPATPPPAATNGAASKAPAAANPPGLETVASPVGRGGPHQAHIVPLPKHFVNGKSPSRPLTSDEYEAEGLYAMQRRFGPDVTLEDYRAAARR